MATTLIMALKQESQGLFEARKIPVIYSGIGLLNASFTTQKVVAEQRPSTIVNLGTAGSRKLEQGLLVECTSFVQRPANSFFVPPSVRIDLSPQTKLRGVVCGSADFVDLNEPLVPCDVMDMESYAMAFVCQKMGINFLSVKYVTDSSNQNTKSDWSQKLKAASEALLDFYLNLAR